MTDWTRDTKKNRDWQREGFQAWQDSLPDWRRGEDARMLAEIFAQAEHSPTLKAALDWARANDIVFYIDRETTVGGHYHAGTGIVAVSQRSLSRAGTLVHEIRHAWQDAHGLLDGAEGSAIRTRRFGDQLIRLSLYEADAYAHGEVTRRELADARYRRLFEEDTGCPVNTAETARRAQHDKQMARYFLDWYRSGYLTKFYGEGLRNLFAEAHQLRGAKAPDYKVEFAEKTAAYKGDVDIARIDLFQVFGKSFGGGNYLAAMPRDIFIKKILSPSAAELFFSTRRTKNDKTVSAIRAKQLQLKAGRA